MTSKITFTAKKSITIRASVAKVWDALINPSLIKQYFFGVEVVTDWKMGSPILYRGTWQGKVFEDKGIFLTLNLKNVLCATIGQAFLVFLIFLKTIKRLHTPCYIRKKVLTLQLLKATFQLKTQKIIPRKTGAWFLSR